MLNSVFTKTIFERRWGLFWWSFTMFAFTLFIMVLYPTFRDSFGASLQNVPESLQSVLGEAADYRRIEGFIELQVFMQMIFLTFIYGIILCSALIAGEEGDGTLQTLLAQPQSRTKVYYQKLLAAAVMLGIVSFVLFLGVWLGAALIGESVSVVGLLQATFMQWLVSMALSLLAFCFGAALGRRGVAGALAGVYAFLSYLIYTLASTATFLKTASYLSPFQYYSNPRILDAGLNFRNVFVLSVVCLALAYIGWVKFKHRDIYQR